MEHVGDVQPVVLTAEAIEHLQPEPLGTVPGASHRVLWRNNTSMAGVLSVSGGSHLGTHAHRVNHHHIWMLEGRALILGIEVGPGAYVHVPAGVDHDIDARTTQGCTAFYLYVHPGDEQAGT